jgi:hypothetical protein
MKARVEIRERVGLLGNWLISVEMSHKWENEEMQERQANAVGESTI